MALFLIVLTSACATAPIVLKKAAPITHDSCYGQEICMTYKDEPRVPVERPMPPTSQAEKHRNGVKYGPRKLSCKDKAHECE